MHRTVGSTLIVASVCGLACGGGGETLTDGGTLTTTSVSATNDTGGPVTGGPVTGDPECPGADSLGGPCTAGLGACRREGTYVCQAGEVVCSAVPGMAAAENCSNNDDLDCDSLPGCEDPDCGPCGECSYCVEGLCQLVEDGGNAYCPDDGNSCTREECQAAACQHVVDAGGACAGGSCDAGGLCAGPGQSQVGEPEARLGNSVSVGPDVDGDGRGDVLVGSPGATVGALAAAGRACLYSGATGDELRCWEGDAAETYLGYTVSLGPDVDGDGYGDALVVAATGGGAYFVGVVHLYSGATGALLYTIAPGTAGQFGLSASLGPDVDGDGRGDVLVGAPLENAPVVNNDAGRAYLFSGATGVQLHEFLATQLKEQLGRSVSLGPDVDGDGRGDILIGRPRYGNPRVGRVDLYAGATYALLGSWDGSEDDDYFGFGVSLGPDADGDGRGDVLVGAFSAGASGRAYLYSGATGALLHTLEDASFTTDAFARRVSLGPDADGDGRGDIVVASPEVDTFIGRVALYAGATGVRIREWAGEHTYSAFGHSVSLGPDFDGDGLGDLVVGAPEANLGGRNAGRSYWFGSKEF